MKPLSTLALVLSIVALVLLPASPLQAGRDGDRDRDGKDHRGDGRRHGHQECHRRDRDRDHHRSSGFSLFFNLAPQPYYAVPVRRAPVYRTNLVADVQVALSRRGYVVGGVDGVAGPRTRAALAAFQYDRGLRPTGEINHATLRALGLI
ncbi:MAG: peptidoglycan-binding domain-containing protein [Candidatus Methylacidiphilales bacterium]|nr:peptidoglycan-binding domain-containing protein [Candidatus Methylacidiphilales bacterium]